MKKQRFFAVKLRGCDGILDMDLMLFSPTFNNKDAQLCADSFNNDVEKSFGSAWWKLTTLAKPV